MKEIEMESSRSILLLAVVMISASARAEPEWKTQSGQQTVFTAAIYMEDSARLVMECRTPVFLSPEITLTLVPPFVGKNMDGADVIASFQAGDESGQFSMVRIGEAQVDAGYRWTGAGVKAISALRKIAEGSSTGPLTITVPGRAPITFKSGFATSTAMQDTVLRCMPSIVRARRQAREMSNVQTILTLERDANDKCRGGGVEDVWAACAERTEYSERLHTLGMCYGKQGESGYQQQWHRCGPTSIR